LDRLLESIERIDASDQQNWLDAVENDPSGLPARLYFHMFPDRGKDQDAAGQFWASVAAPRYHELRCPSRDFVEGFIGGVMKGRDKALEDIEKAEQRVFRVGFDAGRDWYWGSWYWANKGSEGPGALRHLYDLAWAATGDEESVFAALRAELTQEDPREAQEFWARQAPKWYVKPFDIFAQGFLRGVAVTDQDEYERKYGKDEEGDDEASPDLWDWGIEAGRTWVKNVLQRGYHLPLERLAAARGDYDSADRDRWLDVMESHPYRLSGRLYYLMHPEDDDGGDAEERFWDGITAPYPLGSADDQKCPPRDFVAGFIGAALKAWDEAKATAG
jgi:hypothetical protein